MENIKALVALTAEKLKEFQHITRGFQRLCKRRVESRLLICRTR